MMVQPMWRATQFKRSADPKPTPRTLKVASAALASAPSQRFQVAVHQLHDELVVAGVTPAIAVDAADQHLTIVIDFH